MVVIVIGTAWCGALTECGSAASMLERHVRGLEDRALPCVRGVPLVASCAMAEPCVTMVA